MNIRISQTKEQAVVRIACPVCGERVKGIGLLPDSLVSGLMFKCKRCERFWKVEHEKRGE